MIKNIEVGKTYKLKTNTGYIDVTITAIDYKKKGAVARWTSREISGVSLLSAFSDAENNNYQNKKFHN